MWLMKYDHVDEQLGGLIAQKTIELFCNLFGVLANVTYKALPSSQEERE